MNQKIPTPLFIIDASAMKEMFEGDDKRKAKSLMNKFKLLDEKGSPMKMITTQSSFLRALFLTDPKSNINNVQKTLSFLEVAPSFADFRNGEAVTKELLRFAQKMSEAVNKSNKDRKQ